MLKILNFTNDQLLSFALNLQKASYEVEAGLIGSRNIPPLHETADQIRESDEKFIGYFIKNSLAGFIAVEEETPYLRISRLVVSPDYFRRGIGTVLVQHAIKSESFNRKLIVSTGELNKPARLLYEKFGFDLQRVHKVGDMSVVEYIY